jgi:hypothetical protein
VCGVARVLLVAQEAQGEAKAHGRVFAHKPVSGCDITFFGSIDGGHSVDICFS